MSNANAVAMSHPQSFSNVVIARAISVSLNTTGNTAIKLPFLSGGLTNGGATSNSGAVIVRKVSIVSLTGQVDTANVAISIGTDGNAGNLITANTVLSTITAAGMYQDLTLTGAYGANTVVSGATTQALYVTINTASGNTNAVNIYVRGDVIVP